MLVTIGETSRDTWKRKRAYKASVTQMLTGRPRSNRTKILLKPCVCKHSRRTCRRFRTMSNGQKKSSALSTTTRATLSLRSHHQEPRTEVWRRRELPLLSSRSTRQRLQIQKQLFPTWAFLAPGSQDSRTAIRISDCRHGRRQGKVLCWPRRNRMEASVRLRLSTEPRLGRGRSTESQQLGILAKQVRTCSVAKAVLSCTAVPNFCRTSTGK